MGKKILKIVGVVILLLVIALVAAPFVLEAKIGQLIKANVNSNVNATLDFSDARLSLIKSFPNAELNLVDVYLANHQPFEGDTLFAAKQVNITLAIPELFKEEGQPIAIQTLFVDGAKVHVKVNENEVANYEIGKDAVVSEDSNSASEGFTLDLQSYEIKNSKVIYDDAVAEVFLVLSEIQHKGSGDLSASVSELNTETEALVTFELDSTNYLNKNKITLDALIGIDLENDTYTFLENKAQINQLPLVFNGFVKVNENSQNIAIDFKTPSSDFKNFLGVIPEGYTKNIELVETTGDFVLNGNFKGLSDEKHIPQFEININSDNASFKYPNLPKAVHKVFIDVAIRNTTGIVEETYVDINKFSFMIDEDRFNMMAHIKELMGNTKVNAHLDGAMNLANIAKAYPVSDDLMLKGFLNADFTTAFDMASIEKNNYENTKTSGNMSLKDFEYNSSEMANPVQLKATALTFNPKTVTLSKLEGTTGKTDINANGTITNLLGYLFNDEKIKGDFNLKSDTFALSDFMTEGVEEDESNEAEDKTEGAGQIKIPSFLDATINASANTVLYDNLTLKNVKGNLRINDEKATLNDMTTSIFNGQLTFYGTVSTKGETPVFDMKLGLDKLQIGETFKYLELFQAVAPIAEILKGKLDSDIALSGALTDDLLPNLNSLSGDVIANVLTKEVDASAAPLLEALAKKLDFIDPKQLNIADLKTKLAFKDGVVQVKPFSINYKDIAIAIDGSHTFDKQMNYKATMQVPAKYLGNEVNTLIAKIDDSQLENLTIPVIATIGGAYNKPTVTTDISSGIKSLTTRLIEIQKAKLINKGKDKASELLTDILGGKEAKNDTTQHQDNKNAVKDVLGGILGGAKNDSVATKTDSIPANAEEGVVKEAAKDILGGLFGKKKKKDTAATKRDSL